MHRFLRPALLLPMAILVSACAVRLGGPSPEQYSAVALTAPATASPSAVAAQLTAASADIALIAADADSAWFAAVAAGSQLTLSGPGRTGPRAMGFLTRLEMLGDTSLILPVAEGGRIHMHDALYRVDKNRNIDLMLVRIEETPDLRAAVRTLFGYIATDVGADAAILLAVEAATPQLADSVAVLMRATLTTAVECADGEPAAAASAPLQLLYGPAARLTCRDATRLTGAASGVRARVVVSR